MDLVGFWDYMEEIGLFNHPDDMLKVEKWRIKVQNFDGDDEFGMKNDLMKAFGGRLLNKDWPDFRPENDYPEDWNVV